MEFIMSFTVRYRSLRIKSGSFSVLVLAIKANLNVLSSLQSIDDVPGNEPKKYQFLLPKYISLRRSSGIRSGLDLFLSILTMNRAKSVAEAIPRLRVHFSQAPRAHSTVGH